MTISVGDKLPEANLYVMTENGPSQKTTSEIFSGKKVVVFGIVGAFTGVCHKEHMPGYLENVDAIKAKGVDEIICITVNDPFVTEEWAKISGTGDKVTVISDALAEFAKAAGLDMDASAFGLGIRSKRYAAIVEDGTVKHINVEDTPPTTEKTSAEVILELL